MILTSFQNTFQFNVNEIFYSNSGGVFLLELTMHHPRPAGKCGSGAYPISSSSEFICHCTCRLYVLDSRGWEWKWEVEVLGSQYGASKKRISLYVAKFGFFSCWAHNILVYYFAGVSHVKLLFPYWTTWMGNLVVCNKLNYRPGFKENLFLSTHAEINFL